MHRTFDVQQGAGSVLKNLACIPTRKETIAHPDPNQALLDPSLLHIHVVLSKLSISTTLGEADDVHTA